MTIKHPEPIHALDAAAWLRNRPSRNLTDGTLVFGVIDSECLFMTSAVNPEKITIGDAYLEGANLRDAYLPHYLIVPQEGEFLGYKFARRKSGSGVLLTLRILGTSQRVSSLVGRKCRASEVVAIKAEDQDGNEITGEDFTSTHDEKFVWKLNEVTKPESFDADIRLECAPGLHFYITKDEAREFGGWPVNRKYKEPQQ